MSTEAILKVLEKQERATAEEITEAIAEQEVKLAKAQASQSALEEEQRTNALAISVGTSKRSAEDLARQLATARVLAETEGLALGHLQEALAKRQEADRVARDKAQWAKVKAVIERRDQTAAAFVAAIEQAGALYLELWEQRSEIQRELPFDKERLADFLGSGMRFFGGGGMGMYPHWSPEGVEMLVARAAAAASDGMITGGNGRATPNELVNALKKVHAAVLAPSGLPYAAPEVVGRRVIQAVHPDEGTLPDVHAHIDGPAEAPNVGRTMQWGADRQARELAKASNG